MAALSGKSAAARPRRPAFVEVAPVAAATAGGGCRVEIAGAGGSRLSIHFADLRGIDLVALAGGLLRAGR
jgi:hypothetical protein